MTFNLISKPATRGRKAASPKAWQGDAKFYLKQNGHVNLAKSAANNPSAVNNDNVSTWWPAFLDTIKTTDRPITSSALWVMKGGESLRSTRIDNPKTDPALQYTWNAQELHKLLAKVPASNVGIAAVTRYGASVPVLAINLDAPVFADKSETTGSKLF